MTFNPVLAANAAWEANAIEQCRSDPLVYKAGCCYICMRTPPCSHFTTKDEARAAMRVPNDA